MKKFSTVAAATGAILTLSAPAALAVQFQGERPGSRVAGIVTIGSYATITGAVRDSASDGKCARLRGNWDLPFQPDHGFDVAEACGSGLRREGSESDVVDGGARDFEVRSYTGGDHTIVWEGTGSDA